MMMSASPGRGGGDGATYGVDRSTMANSQALTWCAWLRSRRARLRKISGIWRRYSYSLPSRARERLGGAMPTDLLGLAARWGGRRRGLRPRRARLRKISGIWRRYSYSLPSRARERLGGAMPTDLLGLAARW